jgi:hypothetical protein
MLFRSRSQVLKCDNVALKGETALPKALSVADILKCVSLMNKVLN